MEESEVLWKGFVIKRKGPYWIVKNYRRTVGGTFTMLSAAKKYIDSKIEADRLKMYNAGVRKIKKLPINIRKKEYIKLCQTLNITLPPSWEA